MKLTLVLGLLLFLSLSAAPAMADGVTAFDALGTPLVATGGDVIAYFAGSSAGFDSTISLSLPCCSGEIFPNHSTPYGTAFNLGTFAAGTPLVFRLHVYDTGDNWYTGPGALNADGLVHARTGTWVGTSPIPNGTFVGFEDLYGGGDQDFDDHMFVFTNVRSSVPEPGTMALLGLGIAGISFRRRK
jgi:hypothetical protein